MNSSVVAFKVGLKERLLADDALSGVQISIGNPHPNKMQDELIIIGKATIEPLEYTAGMSAANEKYRLDLVISVIGSARTSLLDLQTRAYQIADAIDASVIAWKPAYGNKANVVMVGQKVDAESVASDIREASITMSLNVWKRI